MGIVQMNPPAVCDVVWVVDGPVSTKVVGVGTVDPTHVNVYGLFETVVSMTPHGTPVGTFVAV